MKQLIFSLLQVFFLSTTVLFAQDMTLKLWPNGAPNENIPPGPEKYNQNDNGLSHYKNVSEAEMFVYLPEKEKNTGAAVIFCPGGGYSGVFVDHDGQMPSKYLIELGVTGIVLKYRLPYGKHEIPLTDALQAMRVVRSKASEWGIDPEKIGIAGSSAGGHLASTVATHFDLGDKNSNDPLARISSRPDFMLLICPVVTFNEEWGHMGSRRHLIGEGHNRELVREYSNELHVTKDTPPTFLVHADDDKGVLPRNSVEFYLALKKYGIPAEIHIFQKGGHGFGMLKKDLPVDQWPDLFVNWLKAIEIID